MARSTRYWSAGINHRKNSLKVGVAQFTTLEFQMSKDVVIHMWKDWGLSWQQQLQVTVDCLKYF